MVRVVNKVNIYGNPKTTVLFNAKFLKLFISSTGLKKKPDKAKNTGIWKI